MTTFRDKIQQALRLWWLFLVAGLLFIGVGIYALANPTTSFVGLTLYFAIAILASGLSNIVFSISNRDSLPDWGWYLMGGILDLVIGFFLLTNPAVAAVTLALYVGFWLLFRSFASISMALEWRSLGMPGWVWLLVLGVLGLGWSIAILFNPGLSVPTLVGYISYALLSLGAVLLFLSFRLRDVRKWVSTL